jgi:hypothetical protein
LRPDGWQSESGCAKPISVLVLVLVVVLECLNIEDENEDDDEDDLPAPEPLRGSPAVAADVRRRSD